jgi:hypothetical protein
LDCKIHKEGYFGEPTLVPLPNNRFTYDTIRSKSAWRLERARFDFSAYGISFLQEHRDMLSIEEKLALFAMEDDLTAFGPLHSRQYRPDLVYIEDFFSPPGTGMSLYTVEERLMVIDMLAERIPFGTLFAEEQAAPLGSAVHQHAFAMSPCSLPRLFSPSICVYESVYKAYTAMTAQARASPWPTLPSEAEVLFARIMLLNGSSFSRSSDRRFPLPRTLDGSSSSSG